MGLYQNEQGGFACLALLKIVKLFIGVIEFIAGSTSTEGGQTPATEKEHNQHMTIFNNMMYAMTWQYECVLG